MGDYGGGPDLSALLGQAGAGPPPQLGMPQPDQPQTPDPLASLQDAIHALTSAMVALPDPQDTADAANALTILARVQTRLMKAAPGAAQAR